METRTTERLRVPPYPSSFGRGGVASACSVNELNVAFVNNGGRAARDDVTDVTCDGVTFSAEDNASSVGAGIGVRNVDDGTDAADKAIVGGIVANERMNKSRMILPT
jgi:hypothetical protein